MDDLKPDSNRYSFELFLEIESSMYVMEHWGTLLHYFPRSFLFIKS